MTSKALSQVPSAMNALALKRPTWVVSGRCVHADGVRVRDRLPFDLNALAAGQTVAVCLSEHGALHVLVDGRDRGAVANVVSLSFPLLFLIVTDVPRLFSTVAQWPARERPTAVCTPWWTCTASASRCLSHRATNRSSSNSNNNNNNSSSSNSSSSTASKRRATARHRRRKRTAPPRRCRRRRCRCRRCRRCRWPPPPPPPPPVLPASPRHRHPPPPP